jgi:N-acetylglucosamine-6-sulfatase
MDGRSFKSVLWSETNTTITGRQFLIQHYGQGVDSQLIGCNHSTVNQTDCLPLCVCEDSFNNTYSCVRSIGTSLGNSLYCEFADAKAFVELYDISKDPFQLHNMAKGTPSSILVKYHDSLLTLATCKGHAC